MEASKSSNSNQNHLHLEKIFGTPIETLEPSHLPKKHDIIKYWMFLDNSARTSRKMSSEVKNQVNNSLISSVVSIWKSKGLDVLENKRSLERKFERLTSDANKLGWDPRCRTSKSEWIEEQKKKFDMIFDIGESSSLPNSAPATPLKRKSEELVRFSNSN